MLSPNDYLCLAPNCFLKHLEEPYVYNTETDELYETNEEAFDFLRLCDGSRHVRDLHFEREFVTWCLKEGILMRSRQPSKRTFIIEKAPHPSLRYLELQITARCNLQCLHCYLGTQQPRDLPLNNIMALLREFEKMQGLRLIISGGEPLLHRDFWTLNDALPGFGFRSILLTNGALIDADHAKKLKAHEVQVSLDGIEGSHDYLRGRGSFEKAVRAIRELRLLSKDVSVATMVHAKNVRDFPKLRALVTEMGAKEWNVDVPCVAGTLDEHPELHVPYKKAASLLKCGFGGGLYTSSPGSACGTHLCVVTPDGMVAKCGFFADQPAGNTTEGLRTCWERIQHITIDELECSCQYKDECRGGCRFRALLEKGIYAEDPLQCALRGVKPR